MKQQICLDFPPLYSELAAKFRLHERRDVIFSFGPRLYNPYGLVLSPEIIAHEAVHGHRQGEGEDISDWWRSYIVNPIFRFAEEVEAHRAEYAWLREHGNRRDRRRACKMVAAKLASPMYGALVSEAGSRKLLRESP